MCSYHKTEIESGPTSRFKKQFIGIQDIGKYVKRCHKDQQILQGISTAQMTWFVQQINSKGKKNVSRRFRSH